MSHSPSRMLRQARCTAINEDEHVVSTIRLGPLRSSKYDSRLAMIGLVFPASAEESKDGSTDATHRL